MALIWVLLWVYIPDATPGKISISDFLRTLLLVFSMMAAGFAVLMLVIRYKGLDIAKRFFPQGAVVMWLGKHAFEYSQPKVTFFCVYRGHANNTQLTISLEPQDIQFQLSNSSQYVTANLGVVASNPIISWQNYSNEIIKHEINLMHEIKLIGRNLEYNLIIHEQTFELIRR